MNKGAGRGEEESKKETVDLWNGNPVKPDSAWSPVTIYSDSFLVTIHIQAYEYRNSQQFTVMPETSLSARYRRDHNDALMGWKETGASW